MKAPDKTDKQNNKHLYDVFFKDDDKCLEFLASMKWDNGFECRKCGHNNYCHGKTPQSRRCTRCKSEESATANTIFHHLKFPISKAFFIAYNVCVEKKNISSYQFARKLQLRQMTCWKFIHKLQEAIEKTNTTDIDSLKKVFRSLPCDEKSEEKY
ncbi:MAG: transposase [Bacteroidetes bacterium]|nr:transposase [Bacteroidota bacterium]MBU1721092.1 transposase [Bacteroidota bacterium]